MYCGQGFISQSDPVKWVVTNTSTSIPSALRIKDPSIGAVSASVEFSYEAALQDEFNYTCYDDNSVFRTYIGGQSKRLSRIAVRNADASLADEYTLSHSYATSGTPKLFLSSVSGMKSGRYEFSYNTQGITFPKNNTRACDHWGYWNGRNITDIRAHLRTSAWFFNSSELRPVSNHLYDQMLDGDNCKDPVFEKAKAGALTSVVYPTGGRSDIEYEANTVTRRINVYNGGTSPSPVLENCATENEVGGVRVARITNSSSDGSISDTTSYSYSGGILQQMPKYSEKVSYTHLCYSSHEAQGIGCVMTVNAMGFNNCCGFLLCRDFHVGYPEVAITHQDQSRTVHRFLSAADYLDIHSSGTSWMKRVYCNDDYIEADYTTPLPVCMVHPSTDYAPMRGREASVTVYDAQGNVVSCQENSYTTYSRTIPELFYNDLLTYNRSSYAVVSPQLTRTVRTENGVTVTTDTEYNSLGQVQMQTVSSQVNSPEEGVSSGELTQTTRVRTRYLHESSPSTPFLSAADAIVVTDVAAASGREKIISAQSCTYPTVDDLNRNPFPDSVTAYESWGETLLAVEGRAGIFSRALGGSGRTVSYAYDRYFRPVNVTLPGFETFTYTWQNGVRVTQKTQGTAANRTLFQWKDLVDLSSLGTPDGQRQSYVYDDRNRLANIKDAQSRTITAYEYKLFSEPSTRNTNE